MNSLWPSVIVFLSTLCFGSALYCYQCDSSMSGCGEKLDLLLQKWHLCKTGTDTPMCVKVTETRGTTTHITRACLSALEKATDYRLDMPNVRRHNYCDPGRETPGAQKYSDGTGNSKDNNNKRTYCFCNDWNGCNGASDVIARPMTSLMLAVVAMVMGRWIW